MPGTAVQKEAKDFEVSVLLNVMFRNVIRQTILLDTLSSSLSWLYDKLERAEGSVISAAALNKNYFLKALNCF